MDRNISRMRWKCRRGMLELDIWLRRYLDNAYLEASLEDQLDFDGLLSEADMDIWECLLGVKKPEQRFSSIIRKIQIENNIPQVKA